MVTSTWTWDMTMRAIINDPRYKALKTLQEKKQALSEFQTEKRKQERVMTNKLFFHLNNFFLLGRKKKKRK